MTTKKTSAQAKKEKTPARLKLVEAAVTLAQELEDAKGGGARVIACELLS